MGEGGLHRIRGHAAEGAQGTVEHGFRFDLAHAGQGVALAGLLLMVVYIHRMVTAHDALKAHTLAQAGGRAQQLAAAKAQQMEALLTGADLALRQFRDQAATGSAEGMAAATRAVVAALPAGAIGHFSVSDAQGRVVYPSDHMQGDGQAPLSMADRDYFRFHAGQDSDRLYIHPAVVSRITGQWSVPMTRPLLRGGRFAGVVYANLATLHFEPILSPAALGEHGAATLRMADQSLVHRYPGGGAAVGSRDVSPQLRDIMASGKTAGLYTAPTALDGIERYNAYRKVHSLPMYVIVGLAPRDTVVGWREHVRMLGGLAALLLPTFVVGRERLPLPSVRFVPTGCSTAISGEA